MWIPKFYYEAVPYLYGIAGAMLIAMSWFIFTGIGSALLLIIGSVMLLGGLVLWLRRRDYRYAQRQYNFRSLDEI